MRRQADALPRIGFRAHSIPLPLSSFLLLFLSPPLLLLTACAGTPYETGHAFRVFQENGVIVAETTGGPKYEGELFTYEPVTVLEQDPQNEESLIYSVRTMTMDTEGNIYVADGRNYRIAVFGPDGRYLRSFGRQGSGPGEYRRIEIVDFDGDVFQIWDSNNTRLNRVRRDGTFLDSRPPPNNMRVAGLRLLPDERLLAWMSSGEGREGFAWTAAVMLILSPDGDTLATVSSDEVITGSHREISGPGGMVGFEQRSIPFVSYPDAEYVPGRGIMITTGMTPEVDWYDLSGRRSATYRLDMAVRRVTAEHRLAYEEMLRQSERERAEQSGREPRPIPEQVYPEHAAIWRGGFVDDAGYVWLQVMQLPDELEPDEWSRYFVLDPEGRYLGYARLPNARARIVRGHMLAAIADEETGEDVMTVFRITPIPRGLRYPYPVQYE